MPNQQHKHTSLFGMRTQSCGYHIPNAECPHAQMSTCTNAQMHKCASAQMQNAQLSNAKYTTVKCQMHKCTNAQMAHQHHQALLLLLMHKCTNEQIRNAANTKCTNAEGTKSYPTTTQHNKRRNLLAHICEWLGRSRHPSANSRSCPQRCVATRVSSWEDKFAQLRRNVLPREQSC